MPFAAVNGIRLFYEAAGAGPALVLSSGGVAGTLDHWRDSGALERLAQGCRTVAYDRRYGGRSDAPLEPMSNETWAADLLGLMDALDIASAHLYGASQGAGIALRAALLAPQRVRSLIIAAPTGGADLEDRFFRQTWEGTAGYAERHGMEGVVENPGGPYFERILWDPTFQETLRATPVAVYAAAMRESARRLFRGGPTVGVSAEELRSIALPALIVPGDNEMHPRAVGETIAALMPRARLGALPPSRSDTAGFAAALLGWLAEVEAERGDSPTPLDH